MGRTLRILAIAAAALALPALAQQPKIVQAGAGAEVTTITTRVEAVDRASRVVAIKGPLGRTLALKVDDRVKTLGDVTAGDEIVVAYVEAIAAAVVKVGDGPGQTVATAAPAMAPAGARPGAAVARQTKIVARVEEVGARGIVLLRGPGSRYVEVRVGDPVVVGELEVGDVVEITYAEALVVGVVTPKK